MSKKGWAIFVVTMAFVGFATWIQGSGLAQIVVNTAAAGCGWFAGLALREIQDGR